MLLLTVLAQARKRTNADMKHLDVTSAAAASVEVGKALLVSKNLTSGEMLWKKKDSICSPEICGDKGKEKLDI